MATGRILIKVIPIKDFTKTATASDLQAGHLITSWGSIEIA
jgi:hypothetical protein